MSNDKLWIIKWHINFVKIHISGRQPGVLEYSFIRGFRLLLRPSFPFLLGIVANCFYVTVSAARYRMLDRRVHDLRPDNRGDRSQSSRHVKYRLIEPHVFQSVILDGEIITGNQLVR